MELFKFFEFISVNWSVIFIINGFTVFTKRVFPLIRPWCAWIVLLAGFLYGCLYGLLAETTVYQALEAGFLHSAVASYIYSLIKKPLETRSGAQIKQAIRNITNKII